MFGLRGHQTSEKDMLSGQLDMRAGLGRGEAATPRHLRNGKGCCGKGVGTGLKVALSLYI